MSPHERQMLVTLGKEIQDDLARAERLGRGTVNLANVSYYAERIRELLESEKEGAQ